MEKMLGSGGAQKHETTLTGQANFQKYKINYNTRKISILLLRNANYDIVSVFYGLK